MAHFEIVIRGEAGLLRKLTPAILVEPLRSFLERVSIETLLRERAGAPVDTGALSESLTYVIDPAAPPTFARIGYLMGEGTPGWTVARAMEYGTGRMGDPEVSHSGSHWPPGAALAGWAARHGFQSGWQVAAIIGRRGGLRPRLFLRAAREGLAGAIGGFVNLLADEIRARWDAG